ncbi:MAG: hypothetical protein K2K09_02730, partial [Lachnospiraceae bacterium]|nr:hypothetical protein [Lachnospiraceae bacterium]
DRDDDDFEYEIGIQLLSGDLLSYETFCSFYNDDEYIEIEQAGKEESDDGYYYDDYDDYDEDEDIIAVIEDKSDILNFVKDSFTNAGPIENVFQEGYALVSIDFSSYDYSLYDYDDEEDYMFAEENIYVLVEYDKVMQYLSAHKDVEDDYDEDYDEDYEDDDDYDDYGDDYDDYDDDEDYDDE